MNIEVVLLLYNRPQHTLASLEGLRKNGINKVTAYVDYSDDETVKKKQEKIYRIINAFRGIDINLIKREEKFGLAKSIKSSLNEVFANGADGALLLEDDCILRRNGYDFFSQGLNELKGNKKIRSLCGFLFPKCNFIFDPASDLMLLNRFSTWGWATWADRWRQYEDDLGKIVNLINSIGFSIDEFAVDLSILCESPKYLKNQVDIWSINWILLHFLTSTFAVYPKESVIENIGFDGSGINCETTEIFNLSKSEKIDNIYNWKSLPYFIENEFVVRDFMAKYALKTYPKP